jgi:hypothetical protein
MLPIVISAPSSRRDRTEARNATKKATSSEAELDTRLDEADRLRRQQIERVEHEAELARRRYLHVDPTNRLVAASLEADWNDRLRAVAETHDRVEQQRDADRAAFHERAQQRIRDLAADVPAVWDDPATTPRERKRVTATRCNHKE